MQADVIVVGAGLSGMVAALEAIDRGKSVILVDQEGRQSLGGQAWWSLGGLFMIDTPEQRRLGIKDSAELAWSDWIGSAGFDRPEDANPRAFAQNYVEFAAGPMRDWLWEVGLRWFPVVGWAERGGSFANGHGNSVPRFHITWGTGEGIVKPFAVRILQAEKNDKLTYAPRHRVSQIVKANGAVTGIAGDILAEDAAVRGASTNRECVGQFEFNASAVVVCSGGIGGNHELVKQHWPADRLGPVPEKMVSGVPDFVDGSMHSVTTTAGGALINEDRMWHYTEGLQNWDPIWPNHGIRILPGPSSMWFDALGNRMEAPCFPSFDTLSTLRRICQTGLGHSWFILTQKIIEKEFALSGSEQNPDLTSGKWREVLKSRLGKGATAAVEAFKSQGKDFVLADDLKTLVSGMNALTPETPVDHDHILAQVTARDAQVDNKFAKDAQVVAINGARKYIGDKLIRTAQPHRILDPKAGPLIAVRLHILTRKSLGGMHTDTSGRVLDPNGQPVDGLFAAGEAAGFGGGGYHGYNALEGTFLGGCLYSGRIAGQNV